MHRLALGLLFALSVAGCGRMSGAVGPNAHHGGRYLGVGIYGPGKLWSRLAEAPHPANDQAATLRDDDVIIVVLDSETGEIRQCGNLSGYCIRSNPWATSAPVNVSEHIEDRQAEVTNAAEN